MLFASNAGKIEQKEAAAHLRVFKQEMERALRFGDRRFTALDPDTTNYAQMFKRSFDGRDRMLIDSEYCGATVNPPLMRVRCPYCGVKRADDARSCDGCGGHL